MLNKLTKLKPQILLWLIAFLSISLNIYLISADRDKYSMYADAFDEDEYLDTDNLDLVQTEPAPNAYTIKKGENLKVALTNLGVEDAKLAKIIESSNHLISKRSILPGTKVIVEKNSELVSILTDDSKIEVSYLSDSNKYTAKQVILPLVTKAKYISGTINGSLFSSAKKAGASSKVTSDFINLFSYVVDFQRDIKLGDTFKILYEYQTTPSGNTVKNPMIVYAAISSHGELKTAYHHASTTGKTDYYDVKGHSIKKALLATPINGARISSRYGIRKDPFHGYSRMHRGLDYSAPVGTAILAAGDGIVQLTKNQSHGYGKHVQIKHNGTYSTLYAHMSKFANGVKPGIKIKQGQVIGYVGNTGRSKGPHLHYEVIEKGVKVNPAKVRFPKAQTLKGTEFVKFKSGIERMDITIAELENKSTKAVAQSNNLPVANR